MHEDDAQGVGPRADEEDPSEDGDAQPELVTTQLSESITLTYRRKEEDQLLESRRARIRWSQTSTWPGSDLNFALMRLESCHSSPRKHSPKLPDGHTLNLFHSQLKL